MDARTITAKTAALMLCALLALGASAAAVPALAQDAQDAPEAGETARGPLEAEAVAADCGAGQDGPGDAAGNGADEPAAPAPAPFEDAVAVEPEPAERTGDDAPAAAAPAGDAAEAEEPDAPSAERALEAHEAAEADAPNGTDDAAAAPAPAAASPAPAAPSPASFTLAAEHGDVITHLEAQLLDGSGPAGTVSWSQAFRLSARFALPDGHVYGGDTTTITLPDELMFFQPTGFAITDSLGNVVANAAVDSAAKTIVLTYTSYPQGHSDVAGSFHFYVRVDHSVVTEERDIDLVFDVNGTAVPAGHIHSGAPSAPTSPVLTKSGWQATGDPRRFDHSISVNRQGIAIANAMVTDQIQTSDTYVRESLRVRKGTWVLDGSSWRLDAPEDVTAAHPPAWGADDRSFTIDLGTVAADEGYYITYSTRTGYDPADGEVMRNRATLTGNGTEPRQVNSTATYYQAGGQAEGYTYSIAVRKQDPQGNPLQGARFDVVRASTGASVGTIETDETGAGSLTGLLRDTYRLVEVAAPDGYVLPDGPVEVAASQFGEDKVAVATVVNAPAPDEPDEPDEPDAPAKPDDPDAPAAPTTPAAPATRTTPQATPGKASSAQATPKTGDGARQAAPWLAMLAGTSLALAAATAPRARRRHEE